MVMDLVRTSAKSVVAAVALLSVAACAGDGGSTSPISDSLTGTSLGPKAYDPKSFVVDTRPARQEYMPVGVTPPARTVRAKTPAELAAEQAAMSAQAQAATASGASITAEGARVKATAPKPPAVN